MARITPDVPQRGGARNLLSVVDTYYRPARDRLGESAFSQGLNAASNLASTMSSKALNKDIEEAKMQAQSDVAAGLDPDAELAEVRNGNLFRPHSTAYNQVYSEALGRQSGIEFNENLTLEYERSGLKRNTNPEAFRTWMNERVHGFLQDPENQNEYFLAGAVPVVQQQAVNMGAAHMSNVSRQMERNHIAAVQRNAQEFIMGMVRGERTQEDVLAQLSGLNNQAYGTGLSGPTSRRAILSAYLSVADATDNQDMITGLLSAQESGALNLTPQEWNGVTEQGIAIERDINFRQSQVERAQTAQRNSELSLVSDVTADFYSDPNNTGVPLSAFLAAPIGEEGETMGEMIANSPHTESLMAQAKSAHETMSTVFETSPLAALEAGASITAAFRRGDINNSRELVSWVSNRQMQGYQFNDQNMTDAYALLETYMDPESSYNTQAYKDHADPALDRIVGSLSAPDSPISSLTGEYVGGMSDDIEMRFAEYLSAAFAQIPDGSSKDNTAVREAIASAEQATMDYYRQTDPEMFDRQRELYETSVANGEISITSNPAMLAETLRLQNEQAAADAAELSRLEANRGAGGPDAALILQGEQILGLGGSPSINEVPESTNEVPESTNEVPEPVYNGDMADYDRQLLTKSLSQFRDYPNIISQTVRGFETRYGGGSATEILEQLGITYSPSSVDPVTTDNVVPESDNEVPESDNEVPESVSGPAVADYDRQLLIETLSEALNDPDALSQAATAFEDRYGHNSAAEILEELGITRFFGVYNGN